MVFATRHGLALLTFNTRHFVQLHREWYAAGRSHAGVTVSQQLSMRRHGDLLSRVLRILDAVAADEIRDDVVYLEPSAG